MVAPSLRFGAQPLGDGRTSFRLWAPSQRHVELETDDGRRFELAAGADGWFEAVLPLPTGTAYRYRVEHAGTTLAIADPASRAQVADIDGASLVVDPSAYIWRSADWRGRPWHEAVLYELHVGLSGGFAGVEAQLPALAALGFTAIELMPVADFPGARNWGYDGVLPYAPDASYGTPDDLRRLVDRAHELGLMIFLDVVYNHFGPDGNYLGVIAPPFFRDDEKTPWGSAIDFRRPEVRAFFTGNAIQWVCDYRIDGLRLDAVHAISEVGWLDEMALAVRAAAGPNRKVHLVVENEHNSAERLEPDPLRFDAQWNDDAHHILHVMLTGTSEGYYVDYADRAAERLARVLAEGFDYQGHPSRFRRGLPRGTPSGGLPPSSFIDALQNHDQIGNRAFGDRLLTLCDPEAMRAAVALLLLSPHVPMVFMGEEVGSRTPFLFFTSHEEKLAALVREGRRSEFAGFAAFADPAVRERIPDPNDPATFERSRPEPGPDADAWSDLYRRLLTVRRERLMPHLGGARSLGAQPLGDAAVHAAWRLGDGSSLVVATNPGADPVVWRNAPPAACALHGGERAEGGYLAPRSTAAYLLPALSEPLRRLAEAAGVEVDWTDFDGRRQTLGRATIGRLLDALGHPSGDAAAIAASLERLESAGALPPLVTARVGAPVELTWPAGAGTPPAAATLTLASGAKRQVTVTVGGASAERPSRLTLEAVDEPGYHALEFAGREGEAPHRLVLAVAPPRAWEAPLHDGLRWGTGVQLYALRAEAARTETDAGFGDYRALAAFAGAAGRAGAAALAVSPTHAGFAADPSRFSPYAPSSRLVAHVASIDPAGPFGPVAAEAAAVAAGLVDERRALSAESLVDWPRAGALKLRWLRALFDAEVAELPALDALDPHVRLHAVFEALHAHFRARGADDWPEWPADHRDPDGPAVRAFVAAHPREVGFHVWLQATAAAQLGEAQAAARAAGMSIGLIADLAIGMSPLGSHAWSARDDLLPGVAVGAPPDKFNVAGQSWALATFSPGALRRSGFAPFLATVRAALRHAGGLRIDHVLGLQRLWLVPDGAPPGEGGYVRYPIDDLLNLLILESHRHRAVLIGEDLGTVPAGFRERLAGAGIRGMQVLAFQRDVDDAGFLPPGTWSAAAVAMTSTHDIPTINGWWQGRDIDWQHAAGRERNREKAHAERARLRDQLETAARPAERPTDDPAEPVDFAIDIVARTPSPLVLVPVDDLLGLAEQPNLPGTLDEHPNWRRRFEAPADRLLDASAVAARVARLRARRGA